MTVSALDRGQELYGAAYKALARGEIVGRAIVVP